MMTTTLPQNISPVRRSEDRLWAALAILPLTHMIVDSLSIYTAMRIAVVVFARQHDVWIIDLYNLLAFAPQVLLGWAVDRARLPRAAAVVGAALAALSAIIWPWEPYLALWFAGLGNALFHVAGGSICLQHSRGKAALGGLFVGPGDLGVVLGTFLGSGLWPGSLLLLLAGILATVATAFPRPPATPQPSLHSPLPKTSVGIVILLLFLAVASRQLVGGAVGGPWLASPPAWLAIAVVAMLGKMSLGFVADRWGWMLVAVPLTLAAAPLVGLRGHLPGTLIATFLVQAAMPITLAAMLRLMPRRPAFAFGIASTALWLGGLPATLAWLTWPPTAITAVQLAAGLALAAALLILRPQPLRE
jgi:hypothetical protein